MTNPCFGTEQWTGIIIKLLSIALLRSISVDLIIIRSMVTRFSRSLVLANFWKALAPLMRLVRHWIILGRKRKKQDSQICIYSSLLEVFLMKTRLIESTVWVQIVLHNIIGVDRIGKITSNGESNQWREFRDGMRPYQFLIFQIQPLVGTTPPAFRIKHKRMSCITILRQQALLLFCRKPRN